VSDTRARDLALIACATFLGAVVTICTTWLMVRERIDPIAGVGALVAITNLASFLAGRLSGTSAPSPG
jgi:hypothetical protein